MSQAAKAGEPSMEEILASIRRIIADDEPAKPAKPAAQPAPAPAPARPQSQDDIDALLAGFDEPAPKPAAKAAPAPRPAPPPIEPDVLDLSPDDVVPVAPARPAIVKPIARRDDFDLVAPAPAAPLHQPPALVEPASLISDSAQAATAAAFGSLANTILSQNARTLDDLVKEMLRPMLKNWLDDNLPQLVERLVRAEIERVSRGR